MQRRMTLLLLIVGLLSLGNMTIAQDVLHTVDFEPAGVGADWNWTMAENADNPPMTFIANPVSGGINTSATVAQFTARAAGNPWALTHTDDDGEFTFDAANSTVKIMVYKPVISDVGIKIEGGTGAATQIIVANTLINEWEELTFDFSAVEGQTFGRLVIIPDFLARSQDNILYLDNIEVPDGTVPPPPAEPTVAAPAPTIAEEDVISVFSDEYTDIAGTNFNPGWGQSTVFSDVLVADNSTLLYAGLNYQGTVLGSTQDLTSMDFLHVDFWSTNSTALEVFLISETTGERTSAFTMTNDSWVSTDIPLTVFTDQGLSIADIKELKFVGNGDVYLDNIFFYAEAVAPSPFPTHTVDFEPAGVGADWEWVMAENDDNPALEFVANPVSGGMNTSATVAQFTARTAGNPWALIHTGDDGEFTFDAANSTVKIMVYKPVISDVGFKVEGGTGAPTQILVANTLINEWEELTFDFSAVEGQSFNRMVIIPDFLARAQDNILYLDNIEVPDGTVPPPPAAPVAGAPAPTRPAEDVMSIYSGSYVNLTETNFNPNWGQSTTVTVDADVAGEATLLYETLNYQGTNLGGADGVDQDVSAYDFLHVDFWTPNAPALNLFLISRTTGEQAFALPIIPSEWVSLDIPLAHFTDLGLGLNDIYQLKVDGGDGATSVWFDNWYFYSDDVLPTAPVAGAPVPTLPAEDVMSIYSGAYVNLTETNFNPNWGQSTAVTVDADVAGEATLLYETLNYQGTNLGGPDGVDQDVSAYEFLHVDFWTSNAPALNLFLISRTTGEQAFALPIAPGAWVSMDIPLAYFTDLGMGLTDIYQFKVDGGDGATSVWFDNWYFHGTGPVQPDPGLFFSEYAEGSSSNKYLEIYNPTDMAIDLGAYSLSSCSNGCDSTGLFDYPNNVTFAPGTMLEPGQVYVVGNPDANADIVAASNQLFTYLSNGDDVFAITDTATMDIIDIIGEMGPDPGDGWDVAGVLEATKDHTLIRKNDVMWGNIGNWEMSAGTDSLNSQWIVAERPTADYTPATLGWHINPPPVPLVISGAWKMVPEAGALMVGPGRFDGSWWSSSDDDVITRACFFDDKYIFHEDGTFGNFLGGDTWLETWQGVDADACGAPVAPHDGMTPATFTIDDATQSVTLHGVGSYLGIPKAFNGGELADPADAPESITYEIVFSDSGRVMTALVHIGSGFWTFTMVPTEMPPPPVPMVAAPTPDMDALEVFSIFSDAYTDLAETNFNPNWGQSTLVDFVEIEANSTMAYSQLNYQGTNLGGPDGVDQDVSGYDFIHVDFWTHNADALNFFLISRTSGEQAYSLPITPGEWVGVDIPLSYYTDLGMTMADIYQFKVDGGNGETTVWFDNWFFHTLNHTGVDEKLVPDHFALSQNYPNPFNPSTTINYSIAEAGHVTLKIYNITGQEVVTLINDEVDAGFYSTNFNASHLAAGTYFYALTSGSNRSVEKMVLIK